MRILMVISQNDFRDEELFDTKAVLEQNNILVDVAAPTINLARGKLGGTIKPDWALARVAVADYAGIIFVGGPGAFNFINDQKIHELARNFWQANKLVAAICIAPAILAQAGLLKEKRATVHVSGIDYLQIAGANYLEEDVVRDGQLVTANGPAAASLFGQEIVQVLRG